MLIIFYMKSITQYILESEQSKRMLNPIQWYQFIQLYNDKKVIPNNPDLINAYDYLNNDILTNKIFVNELNTHPERYNTNENTTWYVICGNYKVSWTGFNVQDFYASLNTPIASYSSSKYSIFIFDTCIFIKLFNNNTEHWTAICNPDILNDMNIIL